MESRQGSNINAPVVMGDYIDRPNLARQLGITHRTLELWAHRRKGPRPVLIGRKSFYHVEDVAQWLEAQRRAADPEPRKRRAA